MNRKNKQSWLKVGLQVIGDEGVNALTIQRMTEILGITKGSFYHHFTNIETFKSELIEFWANQYLSTANDIPEAPAERLALLDLIMKEGFSQITEPEVAIRAWAQQNEMVRQVVTQVDKVRNQFVYKVFLGLESDKAKAKLIADTFSTMLIGCITSLPPLPPDRIMALYAEFKRIYKLDQSRA
ncbi:MAG: TetR/AcrR family transcriptional regulator [Gammaproteobacteria bacterium]|nr:TetR/AcrR family transcriptional regulator [candidate division Zixibacteria bacterium]NIR96446.1 TetR/AcrR family transcriptional regulator [Gammaproteobacteria bacterium]NIR63621.1 TetR/AcrR family transcriptional regulator [candidate division Zixibacteria bacterium]NIS45592.1 TetR/AcrR family transcriptional regulator [candidate division Zixibacteria bacterium]NIU13709.1 TetR/AcrR family transcriptional regulator [candidate division Zixibacteria bacterium]